MEENRFNACLCSEDKLAKIDSALDAAPACTFNGGLRYGAARVLESKPTPNVRAAAFLMIFFSFRYFLSQLNFS